MMQKILALVDGSLYSASVCDHAAWISARTGAAVELLHVLGRREPPGSADMSGAIRLGARSALLEELAALDEQRAKLAAQRGRAILEDAREILEKAGVTEIAERLRHGDLVDAVAEQGKEADLILIGKRGEAADFARGHLGSNLERVARVSQGPVFVASRAFKPIKKLLLAHDGGASAQKAVEHVASTPLYAGLDVHLITVGAATDEVRKDLEDAVSRLEAIGIHAAADILPGQPESTLGALVDDAAFDIVVMGAYGHSRIRRLIIGSTTTEMIRCCKAPVVLIR